MAARKAGGRSRSAPDTTSAEPLERLFLPWEKDAPLAARMRPSKLSEFVGQEHILGPGKLLRRAIEADRISSIILWGPPGTGKTTLARVIAGATRTHFETLNAVLSGVKDIREVVARARERLSQPAELFSSPQRTTLFVDEVHRFNKAQQDALLPHVENGTIIFVGATTENPYFEVIKALVSRSRIFSLQPLGPEHLKAVLRRALGDAERGYGELEIEIDDDALDHLVEVSGGDARNLLNALELAVETTPPDERGCRRIDRAVAEESIQRRALLYDKDGDAHYDTISAFIKSLRGSDVDAALFWLAKMLRAGEDPRFVARRLVIFASEDVGMADSRALSVANSAASAVEFVGMPECQWNLSHAVIYLATAPKSNSAMAYFDAVRELEERGDDEIPDPLRDPSRDREGLGHGQGYKYPHAYREHWVAQQYLPGNLQGARFYEPGEQGEEAAVRDRVERLRQAQAEGLSLERRVADLAGGRARRRKQQVEAYGEELVLFRERLLDAIDLPADARMLDLGRPPACLAWGALERLPLGKVDALVPDAESLRDLLRIAEKEGVDRLLRAVVGEPGSVSSEAATYDIVLSNSILYADADRADVLRVVRQVLRKGGRWIGVEPVLSAGRRLSEEVDLRSLGAELAGAIRRAEARIFEDPDDPRMTFDEAGLRALAEGGGLVVNRIDLRRESLERRVTSDQLARWFASGGASGRPSYEERLRREVGADVVAAYRRLVEEQLRGRVVSRPRHAIVFTLERSEAPDESLPKNTREADRLDR